MKVRSLFKKIICYIAITIMFTATALSPVGEQFFLSNSNGIIVTEANASSRLYNQWDSKWKGSSYTYPDGGTLYSSGCGIFSVANAVYSLNGKKMSPKDMADYAYAQKTWNKDGVLVRDTHFQKLSDRFGGAYGFRIKSIKWAGVSDSTLISHLKNGGVAVAHIKNHFIAIDGYQKSSSKEQYHVIDSAVNTKTRNLPASGWVSTSALKNSSKGSNVDWFCLIEKSSTSTSKISMTIDFPTTLTYGKAQNIKGTVSSTYPISQFKGEIIKNGSAVQSKTCAPNSTNFKIENTSVNMNLKFAQLAAGSYTLRLTATDTKGKKVVKSVNFTVKKSANKGLKINPTSYPTTLKRGSSFNLTGTVTSSYKIKSFTGKITKNGSIVQKATLNPNATSVDIKTSIVNKNLKFGSLPAGTYRLEYTAEDANGNKASWVKTFTVN